MIEKIVETIEARGFKQAQVERSCGLSTNKISKWKNKEGEPTASQIFRIAAYLDVPVRFLVDDSVASPDPEISHDEMVIVELVRALALPREEAMRRLVNAKNPPATQGRQEGSQDGTVLPKLDPMTGLPVSKIEKKRQA